MRTTILLQPPPVTPPPRRAPRPGPFADLLQPPPVPPPPRRAPEPSGPFVQIISQPAPGPRVSGEIFGRVAGYDAWSLSSTGPGGGPPLTFGVGLTKTGNDVALDAATLVEIGGLLEAPATGMFAREGGAWVPISATPPAYTFDTGLTLTGSSVNLDAATPTEIGGITEPPADGLYLRNALGNVYSWEPAAAGTAYLWGIGLEEDATTPGTINLLAATQTEIGGLLESPADDALYLRQTTAAGVSTWVPAPPGTAYVWGIGIDEDPAGTINLIPATDTELGGVTVQARSLTQGLALDAAGDLSAPLATNTIAGTIVEPPADGLNYARTRDAAGVSTWVLAAGAVFVGDDPPTTPPPGQGQLWFESDTGTLWVYFDDGSSEQWVQVGGK